MIKKETSYVPALDGLRAISILIVFFSHQGFEHIIPGGLGVTIFFFISGFLITNLLFAEYRKTGRLDFPSFFIRRLLRLYPALLLFLLLFIVFLLIIGKSIATSEILAALFYYENYYAVYWREGPAHFSILWSLAIEEHFYLLFPFLFIGLVRKPRLLLMATIVLVLLPLAFRLFYTERFGLSAITHDINYYLTHCRFDSILIGCLLSIVVYRPWGDTFIRLVSHYGVFMVGLMLLAFTLLYRDEYFRLTYRYSLQGQAFFMLLPPIVYSNAYKGLSKLLSTKVLVTIGRLSYSIYLFHWLSRSVFLFVGLQPGTVEWIVGNVLVTGTLAAISYYGIELKFVALRKRFGSNVKKESQQLQL